MELEAKRQLIERAKKVKLLSVDWHGSWARVDAPLFNQIYHENLDDVKTMNTMLTYAKCATIRFDFAFGRGTFYVSATKHAPTRRDAQLEEKVQRQASGGEGFPFPFAFAFAFPFP